MSSPRSVDSSAGIREGTRVVLREITATLHNSPPMHPALHRKGVSNTPAGKPEHEVKVQFTREFADVGSSSSGPESLSSASSFQSLASTVSSKSSSGICADSAPDTPQKAADTSYINSYIPGLDDLISGCANIQLNRTQSESVSPLPGNPDESNQTLATCDSSFQLPQDISHDQTFASATDGSVPNRSSASTPDPKEANDYKPAELNRTTDLFEIHKVDEPVCNQTEDSAQNQESQDLVLNSTSPILKASENNWDLNQTKDLSRNSNAGGSSSNFNQTGDSSPNERAAGDNSALTETRDFSSNSVPIVEEPVLNQTEDSALNQTRDLSSNSVPIVEEPALNQTRDLSSNSGPIVKEPVLNQTEDSALNHTRYLSSNLFTTVNEPVLNRAEDSSLNSIPIVDQPALNQTVDLTNSVSVSNQTVDLPLISQSNIEDTSLNQPGNDSSVPNPTGDKSVLSSTKDSFAYPNSPSFQSSLNLSEEILKASLLNGSFNLCPNSNANGNENASNTTELLKPPLDAPKEPLQGNDQPSASVETEIRPETNSVEESGVVKESVENLAIEETRATSQTLRTNFYPDFSSGFTKEPKQLVEDILKNTVSEVLSEVNSEASDKVVPETLNTSVSQTVTLQQLIDALTPVVVEKPPELLEATTRKSISLVQNTSEPVTPEVSKSTEPESKTELSPVLKENVAEDINKTQEKSAITVPEVPTVVSPKTTQQTEVLEAQSELVQENLTPAVPIITEEATSEVSKEAAAEVSEKPAVEASGEKTEEQIAKADQTTESEVTPVETEIEKDLPEGTKANKEVELQEPQDGKPQSTGQTSLEPQTRSSPLASSGDEKLNDTVTLQDSSFHSLTEDTTDIYAAFKPQQQSTTLGVASNFERYQTAAEAVATDIYNKSLELVEESDQFVTADCQLFQDAASFDFFLTRSNTRNPGRDLTRQSLYVKFDPLVSKLSMLPQGPTQPTDGEENAKNSTAPPPIETPKRNPALSAIDRLLMYSPARATPHRVEEPQKIKLEPVEEPIPEPVPVVDAVMTKELELVRTMVVQLEDQLEKQKKEHEKELEMQRNTFVEKLEQLQIQLSSEVRNKNQMTVVVDEYEKSISRLVAERERDRTNLEQEKTKLQDELQAANHHLNNTEAAFNDVHLKYERLKGVVAAYKSNEEILKESIAENMEIIKSLEKKYDQLKSHAMTQLEKANLELEGIRKQNEAETVKLQAMVRKAELKSNSLAEMVEQKVKENTELTQILDEVIARVGHPSPNENRH